MNKRTLIFFSIIGILLSIFAVDCVQAAHSATPPNLGVHSSLVWWAWPIILFLLTFTIGILGVLGGVGGAVIFTPVASSFFPFGIDFVRATGLLLALSTSLAAAPGLLKRGLADLRLAIPAALCAATMAVLGAMVGLAVSAKVVNTSMGVTILAIVALMLIAKRSEYPEVKKADTLSNILRISGVYHEPSTGTDVDWKIHRTIPGLLLFCGVGFLGGMFGLGAGWANVPVFNLVMGAPLKVAVATSITLIGVAAPAGVWPYLNAGSVLPLMAIPSIIGMMLGARLGAKLLSKIKPSSVRLIVLTLLGAAGIRSLLKGTGIWP